MFRKKLAKRIVTDTSITTEGHLRPAKCRVQIYELEKRGHFQVVLSPPDDEKYIGKSTTNHFEAFATSVKEQFLPKVRARKIEWVDRLIWNFRDGQETQNILVKIDFKRSAYTNPSWVGHAHV